MDPIVSSLISIVVVFILVGLILWVAKPKFVVKMDKDNKKVVLMDKLLAYSSLVAIIVGLIVAVGMNMMKPNISEPIKAAMRSRFGRQAPVVVAPEYSMRRYSCGC